MISDNLSGTSNILTRYEKILDEGIGMFTQSKSINQEFHSQFLKLLDLSISSNDNQIRKRAESEIEQIGKMVDPQAHLVSMFQVIFLVKNDEIAILEKYLAYILAYLRRLGDFTQISPEDHLQLLACGIGCVIFKEAPFNIRFKLSKCFDQLLKIPTSNPETVNLTICSFLNKSMLDFESSKLLGTLMILQLLINELEDEDLYHDLSQKIVLVGNKILPHLSNISSMTAETLVESLKLINITTTISYKLILKFDKAGPNIHFNPIISEGFLALFEKILLMDFFNLGCSLICFHADKTISEAINAVKYSIVQGISKVAASNYQRRLEEIQLRVPDSTSSAIKKLTSFYGNIIRYLLKDIYLAIQISLEKGIELDQHYGARILTSAFMFLAEMVNYYDYFKLFNENKEEIIVNIILVLLLNTKHDYEIFMENPNEHVQFDEDLVESKISETLKSSVANLLYNFCEKVDGALTFTGTFLVESLYYSLGDKDYKYQQLTKFQSAPFIRVDSTNRIETAFLSITIIAMHIKERKDLMSALEGFLSKNLKNMITLNNSSFVRQRLCLVLKYYALYIFHCQARNQKEFEAIVEVLFLFLGDLTQKAASLQALNALALITRKDGLYIRVDSFANNLFPSIFKMVGRVSDGSYFEFISEFIETYNDHLIKSVEPLVKELVNRVYMQNQEFSQLNDPKINLVITKCLQILKTVFEHPKIVNEQFNGFEHHLEKLFQFFESTSKIPFDEYIIEILNEIIKNYTSGTNTGSTIYLITQQNLDRIFENNKYSIDTFYSTFHYFCYYGRIYIASKNKQLLQDMLRITFKALERIAEMNIRNAFESYNKCCLLIQLMIQSFTSNGAIDGYVNDILDALGKLQIKLFNPDNKYLCARFFQIYYCLLACYPTDVIRDLKARNWLESLFDDILVIYLEYYHNDRYAAKIIVEAVSALLVSFSQASLNEKGIFKLFNVLFDLLKSELTPRPEIPKLLKPKTLSDTQTTTQRELSMTMDNNIIHPEINSSKPNGLDPSFDILIQPYKEQEREAQKEIAKMYLPFKDKDEFHAFRKVFKLYKENYSLILDQLLQAMTEEKRIAFNEILNSRILETEHSAVRKIVKPLKKKEGESVINQVVTLSIGASAKLLLNKFICYTMM